MKKTDVFGCVVYYAEIHTDCIVCTWPQHSALERELHLKRQTKKLTDTPQKKKKGKRAKKNPEQIKREVVVTDPGCSVFNLTAEKKIGTTLFT